MSKFAELVLKDLARYMTPAQLRKEAKAQGLTYEEMLEMTYENMQFDIKSAIKTLKKVTR